MILISYLLQAALALLLAFLGGAFLRNIRGLCDGTSFARSRDRLLGLALYFMSIVSGGLAGSRLAGIAGGEGEPEVTLPFAAPVLGACWIGAVVLGLGKAVTLATVRRTAIGCVVVLVLFVIFANSRITGADIFLMAALTVWLCSTLVVRGRAAD